MASDNRRRTSGNDKAFLEPNFTAMPNVFYDYWLPKLSDPELRVLLYIGRHTLGWQKSTDKISLSQITDGIKSQDGTIIDEGCGIKHRTAISKALKSLELRGLIQILSNKKADGSADANSYRLLLNSNREPSQTSREPDAKFPFEGGSATTALTKETIHKRNLTKESEVPPSPPIPQITDRTGHNLSSHDDSQRETVDATITAVAQVLKLAPAEAHTQRAMAVMRDYSCDLDAFCTAMREAAGEVHRRREDPDEAPIRSVWGYYFKVLENGFEEGMFASIPPASLPIQAQPAAYKDQEQGPPENEWEAIKRVLAQVLAGNNYERWFAPTCLLRKEADGTLVVGVADETAVHWLDGRLRSRIDYEARHLDIDAAIRFVVPSP